MSYRLDVPNPNGAVVRAGREQHTVWVYLQRGERRRDDRIRHRRQHSAGHDVGEGPRLVHRRRHDVVRARVVRHAHNAIRVRLEGEGGVVCTTWQQGKQNSERLAVTARERRTHTASSHTSDASSTSRYTHLCFPISAQCRRGTTTRPRPPSGAAQPP